ncbi:MAG: hypothetical protein BGN85_04710 [Alphaproteobacteria bacterium 64-11]|nr:HPr kinase/phosphatase C-terminal domain-containing protein [Alphaproteobacteria bacterium]OJU10278.1 MAG: hypothetical protein BGN85_04710 [Alphaproteobacteria bacterium 64-11]
MSEVNIHATCVAIGTQGILLLGASGAGKSDLALQLIDGGARLVADDRTILTVKNGVLSASAPAAIRGLMEIRGLGIVKLPVRASVRIALVAKLGRKGARLPQPLLWHPPAPLKPATFPPQILLDARPASAAARIRAALAAHRAGTFRDTFNQG